MLSKPPVPGHILDEDSEAEGLGDLDRGLDALLDKADEDRNLL